MSQLFNDVYHLDHLTVFTVALCGSITVSCTITIIVSYIVLVCCYRLEEAYSYHIDFVIEYGRHGCTRIRSKLRQESTCNNYNMLISLIVMCAILLDL